MNQERLIFKGQLTEQKHKRRELEIRMRGGLLQLRNILNPYVNVTTIDTEQLGPLTDQFLRDHAEITEVNQRIAELEEALNG